MGRRRCCGTLDLLRDAALEEVEDGRAARLLQGQVLFGASFIEDPDLPDRGATLLFGWPDPLTPATWPWQANWVVGDGQDNGENEDELDLFEAGEMEGDESLLAELADELSCSRGAARLALREAALALTRASLLAGTADDEDDAEDDDERRTTGTTGALAAAGVVLRARSPATRCGGGSPPPRHGGRGLTGASAAAGVGEAQGREGRRAS